jgi:glycosyltransferase involved in cell wall biosynthesis
VIRNKIYYAAKPFVPLAVRRAIRRKFASRMVERVKDVWPIMPGSERVPDNWPGWPDGRKFAVVLTHDVEGEAGLDKCRDLMRLELELGFRSSFNFIPEGSYSVPKDLREELVRNGFEVGVHDLKHDGRLYRSKRGFKQRAARINRHLSEWGAAGFRSGFMLSKLDWLHELEIAYDASTFDTDPFEPQPQGCQTIFPFWVPAPAAQGSEVRSANGRIRRGESHKSDGSEFRHSTFDIRHSTGSAGGYVELPYTLPQDFTIFLLLREESPEIWCQKLDWIAQHGGMALVDTHPDYMAVNGSVQKNREYPVRLYREFLEYIRSKYSGEYWPALPKEVAAHVLRQREMPEQQGPVNSKWPHPTFGNRWRLRGKRAAVLLYSYYPADPRPRRAAEALASEGVKVELVCLQRDQHELRREVINGVHVFRVPMKRYRGGKARYVSQYAAFIVRAFTYLAGRCLVRRYDFVHVHNMPDVLVFSALIPKVLGAPIVLDLHDPMPELMMSIYDLSAEKRFVRLLKRLESYSISFADLVLTPNKTFRELFISRGCPPEKIHIVMNSPEGDIFQPSKYVPLSPTSANGDKPFKIMYHGLIAERHGLDIALESIAKLRSVIPALEFHIFGDRTPYMNQVEARVQHLGLQSCVRYHGYQPQHEIARSICSIDLGIIPNRRNPFTELNMPTRIFEYLAMGKPVVVPDTRGIRDYFGVESALFFEPNDSQSLSNTILDAYLRREKLDSVLARGRSVYDAHRWETQRPELLNQVSLLLSAE